MLSSPLPHYPALRALSGGEEILKDLPVTLLPRHVDELFPILKAWPKTQLSKKFSDFLQTKFLKGSRKVFSDSLS
jgi:hypothetical protein